jgi:uncharacterized membrane protein YfcA
VAVAVGTALAYSVVVKLIVVPVQVWRRQVNYRVLGFMLLGGVPGVILGSLVFRRFALRGEQAVLYLVLGVIIVVSALANLYRFFRPADMTSKVADRPRWVTFVMFPIGAEVGFSSAGAGALGTVALLSLTSLTAVQVVGTDLAFGLCVSLCGTGIHLAGGAYDAGLLWKLGAGGVVGALVGSSVASRIPSRQLRFVLSMWLLFIGLQFCYRGLP